jgi:hypothetical protein
MSSLRAPTRPSKICVRCGRDGTQAFTIVDRQLDGSPEWACSNQRTCRARRRQREASRFQHLPVTTVAGRTDH